MDAYEAENTSSGICFYFDNRLQKIRYTCLNSHNSTSERVADTEQSEWLINTLSQTPHGYHIVILTHIFFNLNSGEIQISDIGVSIQTLINAYVLRAAGTWNGIAYDFFQCAGIIACIITGHTHRDYSVYSEQGYPIIGTVCDAQWGSNQVVTRGTSVRGTANEHTFDIMFINTTNRVISTIRIGSGSDRTYNY